MVGLQKSYAPPSVVPSAGVAASCAPGASVLKSPPHVHGSELHFPQVSIEMRGRNNVYLLYRMAVNSGIAEKCKMLYNI